MGLSTLAKVSLLEPGLILMIPPLATALIPEASNLYGNVNVPDSVAPL
jgi:hypothetical protein